MIVNKKEVEKIVKVRMALFHIENLDEPVVVAKGNFELTLNQFAEVRERAMREVYMQAKHEYYISMILRNPGFWPMPASVGLDKASGEAVKAIILEAASKKKEVRAQLESVRRDSRAKIIETLGLEKK